MVRMVDSEGKEYELPGGPTNWDISTWKSSEDENLILCMSIPMYFECENEEVYAGSGVIFAPLRQVLEEYLIDHDTQDEGESLVFGARLLREMAEKYEKAALSCNYQMVLPKT